METTKYLKSIVVFFILAVSSLASSPALAQGFLSNLLRAGGDLTGFYPNPTIRPGVVTSAKIADGAVTGSKIGAGAVTSDKLSPTGVQAGTYNNATITVGSDGRITSASSGELSLETLEVTGSATIGENLDVGGNTSVGVTIVNTGFEDVEPVAIEATSGYVLIDCDAFTSCPITSIADGRPGQTLIIECVATNGLNPQCHLSMNVVPNLAIRNTAFFMNSPTVSAGAGGSGDNITLIWAPRTNFQGNGFRWVEISRVDH